MRPLFYSKLRKTDRLLLTGFLVALMVAASAGRTHGQDSSSVVLNSRVHLGLLYPLSSNGRLAGQYSNGFSFHLLMGLSREERALVLSGVSTVIRERASGLQLAGVSNHVGQRTTGMQLAGVYNHAGDSLQGTQLAGIMNDAGRTRGGQLGGVLNRAGRVDGMQLAGILNKAGDVNGSQFSGLVNIAGKVKGLQFAGLVNIADSSDYPVALLNFIRNGEKSLGLSTDETHNLLISFRSGGRVLYGILEIGTNLQSVPEGGDRLYALGGGLGAHVVTAGAFRLNMELKTLVLDDFHRGEYSNYSLQVLPAWRISERIELFAGPSFNFVDTDTPWGKSLFEKAIWENGYGKGHLRQWYVGARGGLSFVL